MEEEHIKESQNEGDIILQILEDKERHMDLLSRPANFDKAMNHFKATQFFKKEFIENQENIQFCDDCLNPIPVEDKDHVAEKNNFCIDTKNLAELGTGVYLYFHFIKFIFFNCLLIFGIVAIAEIILGVEYIKHIGNFCGDTNPNSLNFSNSTVAAQYCGNYTANFKDYFFMRSNFEVIRMYSKMVYEDSSPWKNNNTLFNIHLLNFICLCVMFLVNLSYVIIMTNLDAEMDIQLITPEDFNLMISDIPKGISSWEELRSKFLDVEGITPICLNPTYDINELTILKAEYVKYKKILRLMHKHNLSVYNSGCLAKKITKEEVVQKIVDIDDQLNSQIDKFDDLKESENFFNGTVFATFNDSYDYETYLDHFPQSYLGRFFRYLNYYMCGCCYNEKKKALLKQTLDFTVSTSPEPSDIKWENLNTTNSDRFKRKIRVLIIMTLVLAISFGVLLALSFWQTTIKQDYIDATEEKKQNVGYILSAVFAIVTSIFNFVIVRLIIVLTNYEKNISQTHYVLSLSIKLLVFTFLNSSLLTVIVSVVNGDWDDNYRRILVSNAFFIFLLNSIYSPLYYLLNPFNIIKAFKRRSIIKKYDTTGELEGDMTQQELNQ